jgi:ribokinase
VLGIGCVAVDAFITVDAFPAPDSKCRVRARHRQCGGLTATSLVAAARQGAACAYAGCLGTDDASAFALTQLAAAGVDLSLAQQRPEWGVVEAIVVIDAGAQTRTIFADVPERVGALPDFPPASVITTAGVLLIDHFGVDGMLRAARIARSAGVPVVADIESRRHAECELLVGLADHLIVPHHFATMLTDEADPARSARALWRDDRAAVVVTCGVDGGWVMTGDAAVHYPALAVEAVDTTGCGDVFHGIYAAGLVAGLPVPERIRRAAAGAALKARSPGGQAGIPTATEIDAALSV